MAETRALASAVLARVSSPEWVWQKVSGTIKDLTLSFRKFTPEVIEREVAGETYTFLIGSVTGKRWYSHRVFPCPELRFVKRYLLRPGDTVIECGAHHGEHTILLSRWAGSSGRVIAVEPMPENTAILRRNIELNRLTNVTVIEKVVGSSSGFLPVFRRSNTAVARTLGRNTIEMESTTIDCLMEELGIVPSLITIDVEGYEYEVLEGARAALSIGPGLTVEVHTWHLPRYGRQFSDLWGLIDSRLYETFIQMDDADEPKPYTSHSVPKGRVILHFRQRNSALTRPAVC